MATNENTINTFKEMAQSGKLVPKQNKLVINKTHSKKEAYSNAAALISNNGVTYKLYIYLMLNKDKEEFNLSSQAFMNWSHCCLKSYLKAVKELELLGFLKEIDFEEHEEHYESNKKYIFNDYVEFNETLTIVNKY